MRHRAYGDGRGSWLSFQRDPACIPMRGGPALSRPDLERAFRHPTCFNFGALGSGVGGGEQSLVTMAGAE
jgi:hypothetical protein